MGETIFFKGSKAAKLIGARTSAYSDTGFRSSEVLKWLYQKMAWATATANNPKKSGRSASLTLPTGGGLGPNGLYTPGNSGVDGRHIPVPHITSVKISNEGDFGSIKKCELAFTVYSLSELNSKQAFFDIGGELHVSYGWDQDGGYGGEDGYFEGVIYNFNYSVRPGGGFDCISYGMSAGINTITGNVRAASDSNGQKYEDSLGHEAPVNDFASEVDRRVMESVDIDSNTINTSSGIGCIEMPTSWAASENSNESKDASKNGGEAESDDPYYYISLEEITKIIVEKVLRGAGGSAMSEFNIRCDGTITKGAIPNDSGPDSMLVSGNPLEVIFPGHGYYGENSNYGFDGSGFDSSFNSGDLSKIMVNVDWLADQFENIGKNTADKAKSPDMSIAKFFKIIFDSIYRNSGTRIQLALVEDINDKDGYTFVITDINYYDDAVPITTITAVTNGSICRSLSLVSKVPSEMQMAAYIGNTSTIAGTNGNIGPATDAPGNKPSYNSVREDLKAAKANIDASGLTPEYISQLQNAIKAVFTLVEDASKSDHAPAYPLSFSATVDGIEGFEFGDAVTTNYLPDSYAGSGICFTVTHVTHQIANNDWTTTIETVCRLIP
jgi:hypothetical protein